MASKKIPERPYVMIASTARDLPAHREQVRLACERAACGEREKGADAHMIVAMRQASSQPARLILRRKPAR
jgi:hypothetical protein